MIYATDYEYQGFQGALLNSASFKDYICYLIIDYSTDPDWLNEGTICRRYLILFTKDKVKVFMAHALEF